MENLLDNYHQMLVRVDALCRGIQDALSGRITCSEGCSSCCTAITLFPVEAAALNAALEALPEDQQEAIRRHVAEQAEGERCPLLEHHRCLLYAARPIICRTHGLPIIYNEGNERKTDCCPLNTIEGESVSGSVIIDLDRLNTLLVAVNALYLSHVDREDLPERLTIAEALKVKS
ncbi:MAG: YkgJ family cysteine cluster protein [Desulfuromonadales bacterium]|nr:YkgJ family cysteine cluster protein [Desulfuromonadales bacterium]